MNTGKCAAHVGRENKGGECVRSWAERRWSQRGDKPILGGVAKLWNTKTPASH
jgi:hypothetical protein